MASVFGISGLRSKLDSWWSERKGSESQTPEDYPYDSLPHEPARLTLVSGHGQPPNLSLLLENLVIPQLIAANSTPPTKHYAQRRSVPPLPGTVPTMGDDDVNTFARLSLTSDARAMLEFIDARMAHGSSVETIFVELLAPAARKLGKDWEDDSGDFVDVTMGLWRIQEILRELTLRDPPEMRESFGARRALFSTMPGEQHSFGTLMVAECFQRAGWDTEILIEPAQSELLAKVADSSFDLVGLTVTCDCPSGALAGVVTAIKAVSQNSHVRLLVGGRTINEQPDLAAQCGADGTAVDGLSAVAMADQLVPAKADCFERLL